MSSRNQRLGAKSRQLAALFPKILQSDISAQAASAALTTNGFLVDYVTDHGGRRYGAVRLDDDHGGVVRLIDNFPLI